MVYKYKYKTPDNFSNINMNSDGEYLTGLWFENARDCNKHKIESEEKEMPIFKETCKWLDMYFNGEIPDFTPKYRINNITPFRKEVINLINTINYGETVTYSDIAKTIAKNRGIARMSSQAVGGAVGWNPIGIIIPCHRVVGKNGSLTGYGGGIKNKIELLTLENIGMNKFFMPRKGTAL